MVAEPAPDWLETGNMSQHTNPGEGAELMNGANSVDEISSAGGDLVEVWPAGDLVDPTQLDEEVVPAAQSLVEATPQPKQQARPQRQQPQAPPPPARKERIKRDRESTTGALARFYLDRQQPKQLPPSQLQEPQPKLAPVPPRQ